jgi:hypothetical protein
MLMWMLRRQYGMRWGRGLWRICRMRKRKVWKFGRMSQASLKMLIVGLRLVRKLGPGNGISLARHPLSVTLQIEQCILTVLLSLS